MTEPKTIIVTGAGRGIGAAIAELAGARGWRVCVNYNSSAEKAAKVVENIRSAGGEAFSFKANMGVEADILSLYRAVEEKWGTLDAIVNNVGIDHEDFIIDADWDDYLKVFNVNVFGLMLSCREGIRRMSTNNGGRGGSIVNIGSLSSRTGGLPKDVIYAASKAAVDSFTHGIAKEVGKLGVRVNCVRPSVIETDIFASNEFGLDAAKTLAREQAPLQRIGQPMEVAYMAMFLASDEASYCTGMCYDVSGGR